MPDKYYLVESGALEKLLRTHFLLTQSTLLFEHLLSHSDRPMFLSSDKVCEVLGWNALHWNNIGVNALSKPGVSMDR